MNHIKHEEIEVTFKPVHPENVQVCTAGLAVLRDGGIVEPVHGMIVVVKAFHARSVAALLTQVTFLSTTNK